MRLIFLLLAVVYSCQALYQCSDPQTKGVRFTVSAKKNRTGNWVAQIRLDNNRLPHGGQEKDLWKISVDQEVAECGDKDDVGIIITAEPLSSSDDSDYELFPRVGYYKLHKELNTWDMARKVCEKEGAHLTIINSRPEARVMESLIEKSDLDIDWYFIGFHDMYEEGHFVTVLGERLDKTGYTSWADGEPNRLGGNEDCGSISRHAKLNDLVCTYKQPFICEKEL